MVTINQPFAFPVSDISQLDMDVERLAISGIHQPTVYLK
jgi:hypothetical protein